MKSFLPKNKYDTEAIDCLLNTPFETIKPDVRELLGWFEDLNWPVTKSIGDFLAQYVNEIKFELIAILNGNDGPLKWGILVGIIEKATEALHAELLVPIDRIANYPRLNETEEYVDLAAKKVLEKLG